MREFNQTEINYIFEITKIITLFSKTLPYDVACEEELFNFWQLTYLYEGERTSFIEDIPHRILSGQLIFNPPGIPHYSVKELNKDAKIGIISFICPSKSMDFFKHKVFTLKSKEKKLLFYFTKYLRLNFLQ